MAEPFLAEIRVFSFNFPPKGWALCNGQTLSINQNQALFSLLGTTYGGDGITNFQLPNLQGRMPIHTGNGYAQGNLGGEMNHTLITTEMASHNHGAVGVTTIASTAAATGHTWAQSSQNPYGTASNVTMSPSAVSTVGGGQPHDNMPPYLVLSFCIALQGIFPSRN